MRTRRNPVTQDETKILRETMDIWFREFFRQNDLYKLEKAFGSTVPPHERRRELSRIVLEMGFDRNMGVGRARRQDVKDLYFQIKQSTVRLKRALAFDALNTYRAEPELVAAAFEVSDDVIRKLGDEGLAELNRSLDELGLMCLAFEERPKGKPGPRSSGALDNLIKSIHSLWRKCKGTTPKISRKGSAPSGAFVDTTLIIAKAAIAWSQAEAEADSALRSRIEKVCNELNSGKT